ncbi:hypothetical protein HYX05_03995 [Candidatus Woesearchaeota archaeon]|nr:hypothetical protein [Candidatus Woesearchaeota archaeon]
MTKLNLLQTKKTAIILAIVLIANLNIAAAHDKEYSPVTTSAGLNGKFEFDFKKISLYLGIFNKETVNRITQRMQESAVDLYGAESHEAFDGSVRSYGKNLEFLKIIGKKDNSYRSHIYNELNKSINLLAQLYNNESDLAEKTEIFNLIGSSLDIFFNGNFETSELIGYSEICKMFSSDLKISCYQKFIEAFAGKTPEEISLASYALKNSANSWDCHFLLHDLGFNIAQKNSLEESFLKCGNNPFCTYGCQHGLAIGYVTKNKGKLSKEEFRQFGRQFEIDSNPGVLNFYHGFGHGFFSIYGNVSEALHMCKLLYNYTDDARAANLCAVGGAHEKFFIENDINFENFSADFQSCIEFGEHDFICKIGVPYGYSQELLWQGNTSLEPVKKIINFCKKIDDEYCYYGVGFAASAIITVGHGSSALSPGVISEFINDCHKIFSDANVAKKYACNAGAAFFRLVFYQEAEPAFMACNSITVEEDRLKCFGFLNKLLAGYSVYGKS